MEKVRKTKVRLATSQSGFVEVVAVVECSQSRGRLINERKEIREPRASRAVNLPKCFHDKHNHQLYPLRSKNENENKGSICCFATIRVLRGAWRGMVGVGRYLVKVAQYRGM